MTTHLKPYPDGLRQLFARASAEEVNTVFRSAAAEIQKNIQMPGFRKGKVPIEMIERQNSPELLAKAENLITAQALETIQSQGIVMFGNPRFNPMSGLSRDSEFTFALVFEEYPKITKVLDFSKTVFEFEECIIDDAFVSEMACKQAGLMDTAGGAAKDGDIVHVRILNKDYSGPKPEAAFDAAKLALLIGKKAGDKFTLSLNDLGGYLPEFLGRVSDPLEFEVNEVSRPKDWGKVKDEDISGKTPFKTKAEYLNATKLQIENMADQVNNSRKTEALTKAVGEKIAIEIPKSLWLNNVRDLALKMAENDVVRADVSLDALEKSKELSAKFSRLPLDAKEGIAFVFWLDEIAEKQKITIEGPELDYYLYRYAQQENMSMADFQKRLNTQDKQTIEREAVREKVITYLLQTYTFKASKTVPFAEVWKRR